MSSVAYSTEQLSVRALSRGRHLVLAPPGSGKTQLLAARLSDALQRGLDPNTLACLTFTNRAARNMVARVGDSSSTLCIGNFHACAIRLLKHAGILPTHTTVLDEEDRDLIRDLAISNVDADFPRTGDTRRTNDDALLTQLESQAESLLARLGLRLAAGPMGLRPAVWSGRSEFWKWIRASIYPYATLRAAQQLHFPPSVISELHSRFTTTSKISLTDSSTGLRWIEAIQFAGLELLSGEFASLKSSTNAADFDDLLIRLLGQMIAHPEAWPSEAFAWIQVDEAQDLNCLQWTLIDRLATSDPCLVAFADPEQGIFSFLGALPETLTTHTSGFHESRLSVNFRSPPSLVALFREYRRTHFSREGDWVSGVDSVTTESPPLYLRCANTSEEHRLITGTLIGRCTHSGGTAAVLTRLNEEACQVSQALTAASINHFRVSQFDLFRLAVTKDFLAYLQLSAYPLARLPWARAVHIATSSSLSLGRSLDFVNEAYAAGVLPHWLLDARPISDCCGVSRLRAYLRKGRLVVLDTETTGLDPSSDDIIQFAATELIDGTPGRKLDIYLRTAQDLAPTQHVHKITPSTLDEQGLDPVDGLSIAVDFIGDSPVCGHNLAFDLRMLAANIKRRLGDRTLRHSDTLCTQEMAVAVDPLAPRFKLEALIEQYGLQASNSHDASDDVDATALLAHALAEGGREAQPFLRAHESRIACLRSHWQSEYQWLKTQQTESCSFTGLFERFLGLGHSYPAAHVAAVKTKLIRHMQHCCGSKPLHQLLSSDLPPYLIYSEPDLIMESDNVVVSTIHRAKGLEFDSVIITNCHDDYYPNYYARTSNEPEKIREDARLLYVAMTRAKSQLIMLCPERYTNRHGTWPPNGTTRPSRFLEPVRTHLGNVLPRLRD